MPPNDQEPAYRLVDPSTGNIVGSFYENGSGDVEIQPFDGTQYKFAQSPSDPVDVARLQDVDDNTIEVFESDGTFDATDIDTAYVEVVGGGGGGGDNVDDGSSTIQINSGGGGGGYASGAVDLSSETSVSITVGAGGAANSTGGNSSFGTLVEATGGGAGKSATGVGLYDGGIGGTGTTGDVTIPGGDGDDGISTTDDRPNVVLGTSATGGGTVYSNGSPTQELLENISSIQPGKDGEKYGGGGGGAINISGNISSADSGGAGADGIVIVRY
jgi:hypothetical protein